jgi:hypothetical protein
MLNNEGEFQIENKMEPTYLGYAIIIIFVVIALLLTIFFLDSFLEKLFGSIAIVFFVIVGVRMNYIGDKYTPSVLQFKEDGIQTFFKDGEEKEFIRYNRIINVEPSIFSKKVYNFYYRGSDDSSERKGFGVTKEAAFAIEEELKRKKVIT